MPIYLNIDGVSGDVENAKHKDELLIESFSWGLVPDESDKLSVEDFQFTSRVSKASPILMLSCATHKAIGGAVLTAVKSGEREFEFLVIKMRNVLVTSYQQAGSAGDVVPVDSFSLNFDEIEQTYVPQLADGNAGTPVTAAFAVKDVEKR